jgi:hypothetical protein
VLKASSSTPEDVAKTIQTISEHLALRRASASECSECSEWSQHSEEIDIILATCSRLSCRSAWRRPAGSRSQHSGISGICWKRIAFCHNDNSRVKIP